MNRVHVEQKSYQMTPQNGFTVAYFLTVADVGRSLRFYETVFGGVILSRGDSSGAPGYIRIANTWVLVNPGGGPTPDKPSLAVKLTVTFVLFHALPLSGGLTRAETLGGVLSIRTASVFAGS